MRRILQTWLLLSVAVSAATSGASRIATYLHHHWQLRVVPSTVQRALRRAGAGDPPAAVSGDCRAQP